MNEKILRKLTIHFKMKRIRIEESSDSHDECSTPYAIMIVNHHQTAPLRQSRDSPKYQRFFYQLRIKKKQNACILGSYILALVILIVFSIIIRTQTLLNIEKADIFVSNQTFINTLNNLTDRLFDIAYFANLEAELFQYLSIHSIMNISKEYNSSIISYLFALQNSLPNYFSVLRVAHINSTLYGIEFNNYLNKFYLLYGIAERQGVRIRGLYYYNLDENGTNSSYITYPGDICDPFYNASQQPWSTQPYSVNMTFFSNLYFRTSKVDNNPAIAISSAPQFYNHNSFIVSLEILLSTFHEMIYSPSDSYYALLRDDGVLLDTTFEIPYDLFHQSLIIKTIDHLQDPIWKVVINDERFQNQTNFTFIYKNKYYHYFSQKIGNSFGSSFQFILLKPLTYYNNTRSKFQFKNYFMSLILIFFIILILYKFFINQIHDSSKFFLSSRISSLKSAYISPILSAYHTFKEIQFAIPEDINSGSSSTIFESISIGAVHNEINLQETIISKIPETDNNIREKIANRFGISDIDPKSYLKLYSRNRISSIDFAKQSRFTATHIIFDDSTNSRIDELIDSIAKLLVANIKNIDISIVSEGVELLFFRSKIHECNLNIMTLQFLKDSLDLCDTLLSILNFYQFPNYHAIKIALFITIFAWHLNMKDRFEENQPVINRFFVCSSIPVYEIAKSIYRDFMNEVGLMGEVDPEIVKTYIYMISTKSTLHDQGIIVEKGFFLSQFDLFSFQESEWEQLSLLVYVSCLFSFFFKEKKIKQQIQDWFIQHISENEHSFSAQKAKLFFSELCDYLINIIYQSLENFYNQVGASHNF